MRWAPNLRFFPYISPPQQEQQLQTTHVPLAQPTSHPTLRSLRDPEEDMLQSAERTSRRQKGRQWVHTDRNGINTRWGNQNWPTPTPIHHHEISNE